MTPLFFLKGLNRRAAIFSCILIAFSPAFVYYSRYYIQEILLVFFTAVFLGCGWMYIQTRKLLWIIVSGIAAGLMHATKETFILSLLAAFLSLFFCFLYGKPSKPIKVLHILGAVAVMVVTSLLFYSSFGTNPGGIMDSVRTYGIWLQHASGQSTHIHPWYYYLDLLTWVEFVEPITWNEDVIIALGAVGLILALFRQAASPDKSGFMRFFAIYTLVLTIIYSAIPYKTPWCVLSFLYGMVILAGWAIDRMIGALQARWGKICAGLFILIFGIASPAVQSWFLNFRYASDPVNPYVYAHTSMDVFQMIEAVKNAAHVSEEGQEMPVYVIADDSDYWPLPWYLRNFKQVGYWSQIDPSVCNVPVILANAQLEQELLGVLYSVPKPGQKNLYVPLFGNKLQLRPGVEWRGYIRHDLWDRMNTADTAEKENEQLGVNPLDKKQIENLVHFSHSAMNTTFEVFIQDTRGTYAGQAARAAFKEVDRLERLLSRFIQNSDIGQINAIKPNQEIIIDPDTFQCLQIAGQAWQLTDGAFDVTLGNIIEAWKSGDSQKALSLQ
ncbi:MAG: TIGR03663 family protein, partial [Chloroflexi bacterium]|nr:TIGR03663 family protein [Chloroflexota bacterium]